MAAPVTQVIHAFHPVCVVAPPFFAARLLAVTRTLHRPRRRPYALSPAHPHPLHAPNRHRSTRHLHLYPRSQPPLTIHSTPNGLVTDTFQTQILTLPATTFTLTVPGKLTRTYRGAFTLTSRANTLIPVVVMDTETAVASIVAAEAPPHAQPEALKAQSIASRSFLLANLAAHHNFDACDTTHCQFLRSPPPSGNPAALATQATHHLVLTWRASPAEPASIIPAMYSRSCGGHTHAHPTKLAAYPFYAVPCAYCLRHPESWTRPNPGAVTSTEEQRLAFNRTHGWSAIPSNTHTASSGQLEGRGTGHGIGLCQLGAEDLARRGATYAEILRHFYPNTSLIPLP